MSRDLPNLDWLRVFSAATESFALAALRLGVTPGAVSQRIKALEAFLGVSLFQRYPQGVKPKRANVTRSAYGHRSSNSRLRRRKSRRRKPPERFG